MSGCRSVNRDIHPELLHLLEELGVIEIREETVRLQQLRRVDRMLRLKLDHGGQPAGSGHHHRPAGKNRWPCRQKLTA